MPANTPEIITERELIDILAEHRKWLSGVQGAKRADFKKRNLQGLDLSGLDLRGADFRNANLSHADLSNANLSNKSLLRVELAYANLREADLSGANLRHANIGSADLTAANLNEADFRFSNLRGADLDSASLRSTVGEGRFIVTLQTRFYSVNMTRHVMQIGCKRYAYDAWWGFSDDEIDTMHEDALAFWTEYKEILRTYYSLHFGSIVG